KYLLLSADCELYKIAIVMCPDRKLKWFKDHDCTSAQIRDIKKLVVTRFKESYALAESSDAHEESGLVSKNKWVKKSATNPTHGPSDDITTYLLDPVLASDASAEAGGYIKYWHLASTCLAKMDSDFCSVPGKCTLLCDVFRPSHVV
ncbi:hypothetical protein L208DRAFT_1334727, partial [Tricholoma matsutake]